MSSSRFPLPVKIEHNNSFSDHDYCFKETGIMDEQSSFFVDVENEDENDYNARGRKRRNVKQPELFSTSNNNTSASTSNGKRVAKAKPRKSGGKGGKRVEKVKYEVEYIWGKRADKMKPGKLEYRVFWKTYPIEESSWEPEENLRACQESIDTYEQREMYFNEKGEKEMHATKASQENNVRVVVVNKAKTLRQVLPTMHAPRAASVSRTMSIPALPKKNKNAKPPAVHNQKKPSPKKAIVVTTKRHLAPPPSPPPPSEDAHLAGAKKRKSSSSASSFNGSSSTVAAAVTSAHSVSSNNNNGNGEFINSEMGAKTIEELAAKLHAKQVVAILGHEPCDIDGVPYVFRVRFGDDSVKRVIMRDLLDNSPRTLAEYLADAMKRAETVGTSIPLAGFQILSNNPSHKGIVDEEAMDSGEGQSDEVEEEGGNGLKEKDDDEKELEEDEEDKTEELEEDKTEELEEDKTEELEEEDEEDKTEELEEEDEEDKTEELEEEDEEDKTEELEEEDEEDKTEELEEDKTEELEEEDEEDKTEELEEEDEEDNTEELEADEDETAEDGDEGEFGVEEEDENRGEEEEEDGLQQQITLFEGSGELVLRDVEEIEEERKREKAILKERMRRVREPHLRRKMVLQEPCIPWEYGSNQFSSQKGSCAFGSIRNSTLKVHSSRELFPGDPTALPRWSRGTGNSQAGQTPFGMIREQVTRMVEHEGEDKKRCQELLQDPKQTERILKLWARSNPEAKNSRLFGSKRPEKMVSIGGREWSRHELMLSRAALPRLACVNETSAARDGREAIRVVAAGNRQATMHIAGLDRTERDQLESNKCMSWLGGQLILQTQSGTGGFQTPRDVVSTSYYDRINGEKAAKEERQRKRRKEKMKPELDDERG
uniref:Chromo domain-containing protein n=1 Tax=Globodera rostochiensis TaxID=31243 RepID=A0A914H604_GLORO